MENIRKDLWQLDNNSSINVEDPRDREIWEYIARKNIYGIEQSPCFISPTVKKLQSATIDEQIEYVKKRFRPLLPDKYEFIHRNEWLSFEELRGCSENLLYHSLWEKVNSYIYENFQPCSDTLIIQQCSNQKTYIDNTNYKNKNLKLFQEGYCDLAVNSICLVPIEFTIYYPFRHYDWNHNGASSEINKKLLKLNINNAIKFIDNFKYKRVLLHGPYNKEFLTLYNGLKKYYKDNNNVEVILIYTEKEYKELDNGERSNAILQIRYSDFTLIKNKIKNILNYNYEKALRKYKFGESIKKKFDKEFYILNEDIK